MLRPPWRGSLLRALGFLVLAFLAGCSSAPKEPPVSSGGDSTPLPVVREALHLLDTPYRFGEETPERGFDCSGLVHYVYGRHGIPLPRTAKEMARFLQPLEEDLKTQD
ncbi:MAG: peptidoglycan endopeptidase [Gammaproteobacteria bacterium]|nr:peptidoglycan endopeptidase [Gammaproteobacteria bacterium]